MEWINVKDKLPETIKPVLGFCVTENDQFEWTGFISVYFDVHTGWHRCEF